MSVEVHELEQLFQIVAVGFAGDGRGRSATAVVVVAIGAGPRELTLRNVVLTSCLFVNCDQLLCK